jgi:hypothetical protein
MELELELESRGEKRGAGARSEKKHAGDRDSKRD